MSVPSFLCCCVWCVYGVIDLFTWGWNVVAEYGISWEYAAEGLLMVREVSFFLAGLACEVVEDFDRVIGWTCLKLTCASIAVSSCGSRLGVESIVVLNEKLCWVGRCGTVQHTAYTYAVSD